MKPTCIGKIIKSDVEVRNKSSYSGSIAFERKKGEEVVYIRFEDKEATMSWVDLKKSIEYLEGLD